MGDLSITLSQSLSLSLILSSPFLCECVLTFSHMNKFTDAEQAVCTLYTGPEISATLCFCTCLNADHRTPTCSPQVAPKLHRGESRTGGPVAKEHVFFHHECPLYTHFQSHLDFCLRCWRIRKNKNISSSHRKNLTLTHTYTL